VFTTLLTTHYELGVAVSLALGMRIVHTIADLLASILIEAGYRIGARRLPSDDPFVPAMNLLRDLKRSGLD
jgi:hypothetical protein